MRVLASCPQGNAWLLNKDINWANENFDELEERIDELDEAFVSLVNSLMTCNDIMTDLRLVLCGYSEGENTYPEVE